MEGLAPSDRAREDIVRDIREQLGVEQVTGRISVEPDVAFSPWLDQWQPLLAGLGESVFGVTINDQSVLLTGTVENTDAVSDLDRQLETLFPERNIINWAVARESLEQ